MLSSSDHATPTIHGLTTAAVTERAAQYGPNRLPVPSTSTFRKALRWVVSPVSLMLLAAALLSLFNGSSADFWIIIVLFCSNMGITLWHEGKADASIQKLQAHLTVTVRTLRDGVWTAVPSTDLVPDDVVELHIGSVVPADAVILSDTNLSIDESVLTGESLPVAKAPDAVAYAGSFVATGQGVARVTAIGASTTFGKTVTSVDQTPRKSALERDILLISKFISFIAVGIVVVLTIVSLLSHQPISTIMTLDLSLLIAGIPVALPTVMSLIISAGVVVLAQKQVIVRRLASLEDLANVDLLLSDKTGTLTEHTIHVARVIPFDGYDERTVLAIAAGTVTDPEDNVLDRAVSEKAAALGVQPAVQRTAIPGDSERKRITATVVVDGADRIVSLGAPQVIAGLCAFPDGLRERFAAVVSDAAAQGYRAHVLAMAPAGVTTETNLILVGVMLLADKVRSDAAETIRFMRQRGIETKMLTGDSLPISVRVAHELGLQGTMYPRSVLDPAGNFLRQSFAGMAGLAEVLPNDKYDMVHYAQQRYTVAVTGDGVNDLPAVKAANVGFAVANAVDALKSTADIVLLASGIAVIKDAIVEARKIFTRLYNYSVYRMSESFRLVITIAVIGLLYHTYPMTPVQIIILAFLNDVPIVSLAFDRVSTSVRPSHIDVRARFTRSLLFGSVGVVNSLLLLILMTSVFHVPWTIIQTVFFLKLTVSGHMLVYVAHTEEPWYRFLPSRQVILATTITQLIATGVALLGLFVTRISIGMVGIVWGWAFFWMQVSEVMKILHQRRGKRIATATA